MDTTGSISLVEIETLLKSVNTPASVHELLLASKERMAFGADINTQIAALGGTGLKGFAAGASHGHGLILGMDTLFHVQSPLSFKNNGRGILSPALRVRQALPPA